jgi:hypothetical protein
MIRTDQYPICQVCGLRHYQPATGPHINQYDKGEVKPGEANPMLERDPYFYVEADNPERARAFFGLPEDWPCEIDPKGPELKNGRTVYRLPSQRPWTGRKRKAR